MRHQGLALVAESPDGSCLLSHPLRSEDPSELLRDHLLGLYGVVPADYVWSVRVEGGEAESLAPAEREEERG